MRTPTIWLPGAIGETRTKLLLYILWHHDLYGFAPTLRRMCDLTGKAMNGIHGHLVALKRDGLITWEPHKSRTIRPTCRFIHPAEL